MFRCAVLDDYQHAARKYGDWDRLAGKIDLRVYHEHFDSEDSVARVLADCEIAVAMRERTAFTPSLFARLPKLKLLVTTGPRNAAVDMAAAAEHGVTVCGTGSHGSGTAELTWALILAFARHIPLENNQLRAGGRWQSSVGMDIHGKRLGVLGLGRLGQQVANIGKAFGMQIQAWSQNLTAEKCAAGGVEYAGSLDQLLATSDILSIHLILSRRTRGLIGDAQLRLMKPTALLVNTSRGPIVDEAALVAALRAGRLGGAALDVFEQEPLPATHPFRHLDNVLATPHIGYVTEASYGIYFADVVADIAAWVEGKPVRVVPAQ